MKMTNKLYKLGSNVLLTLSLVITIGCSDDFLAEKRPYGSFGPDLVYGDWSSVKLRLNYIYQRSLPYCKGGNNTTFNFYPDLWPIGYADALSKNTDEFTGFGEYNDPNKLWTNTDVHKYFFYGINESPWKKIRECNDVIQRTNESVTLTDEQKRWVEAQARFFRATRYFRLFKRYGGVPIVRTLQGTLQGEADKMVVSRNSTEDTYKFMIEDCTYAGDNLPVRWEEEVNDWGRITAGTGYALAGLIANYYASPVFNRADEAERWEEAYEINKKALNVLEKGHFGLAFEGNSGNNARNWARIWCNMTATDGMLSEGVYVALCNNAAGENDLFNAWEQTIRPRNANGGGGIVPPAELVDAFPMADGKRPTEAGKYSYNKKIFFLNRDPRFYRTFAFPGVEWKFNGSISATGDLAAQCPYSNGNDYKLMNFAWYASPDDANNLEQSGYFTDLLGSNGNTVYVRKKSQDANLGESPLYVFQEDGGFKMNGQPGLAIRYTEVLLNFAEAACGANHLDEAWNVLIRIRQRIGYEGDCGFDPIIKNDRARMFEAILYERRIELAYEGKRFDDCHRWMLFDGGAGQEEIYNNWKMTGWNGNTCNYLGVEPLNNVLRHKLELHFDPTLYTGPKNNESDPFIALNISKPKALTLTEDMTTNPGNGEDMNETYNNANVQALAEFYAKYLIRKDIQTMISTNAETGEAGVTQSVWSKNFYLLGLAESDQENNPGVVQTIGWNSRFGGMGIFDPLSRNPVTNVNQEEQASPVTDEKR